MAIVVFEGSNGSGKTTVVEKVSKIYNVEQRKSIPDWFRKYISFARSCDPITQKEIYMIGHEANFNETCVDKDYIFDRFFYSTIIRLNYSLNKSVEATVSEILTYDIKPQHIFYITSNKDIIISRLELREGMPFNERFFEYENQVYEKLSNIYDIISTIENNGSIEDTIEEIKLVVKKKKLFLKGDTL